MKRVSCPKIHNPVRVLLSDASKKIEVNRLFDALTTTTVLINFYAFTTVISQIVAVGMVVASLQCAHEGFSVRKENSSDTNNVYNDWNLPYPYSSK